MSTKKDAIKTSSTNLSKKKVSTKASSKREDSTDRKNVKKTEVPHKTKTKAIATKLADRTVDNNAIKNSADLKVEKPLKVQSTPHGKQVPTTSTRKNIKTKVPVTPSSKRVSKTQYFPSKNLYANALKVDESVPKNTSGSSSREITKKVSQDKNDAKIVINRNKGKDTIKKVPHQKIKSKPKDFEDGNVIKTANITKRKIRDVSPDSSSISERPRTATLRKGSIVNANIVGPDVPKQLVPRTKIKEVLKVKSPSPKSERSDEYNYEDDFESYESDFEEYFSSSSVNLDDVSGEETSSISSSSSGTNVNLPTELKSTQNRTSSAGTDDERKMDSGHFDMPEFKHKQVLDNIKESIEKENANLKLTEIQRNNPASLSDEGFEDQKSLQFINFLDAKKKYEHRKSMEIKRKRGEEILNMIRLDTCNFTLFELPPVTYEVFIKSYGRNNTIQTGVQTGEDNVDEDIQTEEIANVSKWTQFPVCFSKIDADNPNYWQIYRNDYLGVGGNVATEDKVNKKPYNENSLIKFLLSTGNLILKLQIESNLENNEKIIKNTRDIPFSDGYVLFNTSQNITKDCSVKCFSFSPDSSKILTVHSPKKQNVEGYKSVVCVWTVSNSEEPDVFFISYGEICCCSFGLECSDYIFAGLNDGTISVWDFKKKIYNEDSLLKRAPLHTNEIGTGHISKIVSLQPFTNYLDKTTYFQASQTNEICSLDEEGDIIVWSVILKHSSKGSSTSSSTSWNDLVLVKNSRISLKLIYPELEDLQCTDFAVNSINSNYVLVSTNYGFIIHHLIKGGRSNVKKFAPESPSTANCIEVCPFSPNYFLAGFNDGNINLYSRLVEKPIMVLSDREENLRNSAVQIIKWSKNKPFVIYAKDVNNTIHIWDLNESDIYPIFSIPFGQNITCMKLSPMVMDDSWKKSYMIIGTEDGKLYLHLLNKEHGPQPNRTYKEHLNTFLKYVNRL